MSDEHGYVTEDNVWYPWPDGEWPPIDDWTVVDEVDNITCACSPCSCDR